VGPPDPDASLEELVREHAALRRVATLVAREPPPAAVFEAVAREVGTLLGARRAQLVRVASPEEGIVAASWSDGTLQPVPVGHRAPHDGRGVLGRMLGDPRPVRIEDWDEAAGGVAALMRSLGIRSGAAGPIVIGGRVWGAVSAVWSDPAAMPVGAEHRVAEFAQLVAYAIENAEARNELAASRARLVEAADEARRRIERDLHDGAQQRLVAAALDLTLLEQQLERDVAAARAALTRAREQLDEGLSELRDLARGIHPSVLTDRGLEAALQGLAKRAPVPVDLDLAIPERLDRAIEAAAYFGLRGRDERGQARTGAEPERRGCRDGRQSERDGRGRRRGRRGHRSWLWTERAGRPRRGARRPSGDRQPTRRWHSHVRPAAHAGTGFAERIYAGEFVR
jgi:signal transduction histidine kinase